METPTCSNWTHQRRRRESEWPARISSHKKCHNFPLTVPSSRGGYRYEISLAEAYFAKLSHFIIKGVAVAACSHTCFFIYYFSAVACLRGLQTCRVGHRPSRQTTAEKRVIANDACHPLALYPSLLFMSAAEGGAGFRFDLHNSLLQRSLALCLSLDYGSVPKG